MARRKEDAPAPGAPAWMATFSDLMNLLLCFFVMLFSMSTVDEAKLNAIVAAMNNTFSIFEAGSTAIGDGILISNGVSQLNELGEYINSTGMKADSSIDAEDFKEYENSPEQMAEKLEEMQLEENEELAESVQEAVQENNIADQVEVNFTSQYVELTMKGNLLFSPGKAEIKGEALEVLDKVAMILERYGTGTIEIEGHTDNVPMQSGEYASNEELSSARALSVFYYLLDNSFLEPARLKHAGMGQRVPVADNSTEEGRSKNRRVEIRIYNPS